jgi:hypothetical protein
MGGIEARVAGEAQGSIGSGVRVLGLPPEYSEIQRCS